MREGSPVQEMTACEHSWTPSRIPGGRTRHPDCFHGKAHVVRVFTPDPVYNDPPWAWTRSSGYRFKRIVLEELGLDY